MYVVTWWPARGEGGKGGLWSMSVVEVDYWDGNRRAGHKGCCRTAGFKSECV